MSNIEQQLASEGFYVSTTVGTSMWPMLRNRRDRVIIRAAKEEPLKRGDLPLYRYPDGRYVLHRVIGVREDHYVIRGDNTYQKERIPKEWILGKVTEFYRGEKHVDASSRLYRAYAGFWQGIFFLRYPLFWAKRKASALKRRLFRTKK